MTKLRARIVVLTKNYEDAVQVARFFGLSMPTHYGYDQAMLNERKWVSVHVDWWKGDDEPIAPDTGGLPFYWQGEMDVDTFIRHITRAEHDRKVEHQAFFNALCETYPLVEFETSEGDLYFTVAWRLSSAGGSSGRNLNMNDPDAAAEICSALTVLLVEQKALRESYPHLYFSYGGSVYDHIAIGGAMKHGYAVFTASNDEWGFRAQAETNVFVEDIDADADKLAGLNEQAKLASQDGWFFCSVCRTAKLKDEYVAFHFYDVRCKDCATPRWIKMAKEETYN